MSRSPGLPARQVARSVASSTRARDGLLCRLLPRVAAPPTRHLQRPSYSWTAAKEEGGERNVRFPHGGFPEISRPIDGFTSESSEQRHHKKKNSSCFYTILSLRNGRWRCCRSTASHVRAAFVPLPNGAPAVQRNNDRGPGLGFRSTSPLVRAADHELPDSFEVHEEGVGGQERRQ